jgi:predicted dehydrogenase
MREPNRRIFLGTAAAAATLARRSWAQAPADRVRMAVIGLNGRGSDLTQLFAKTDGVEIVALCDADTRTFSKPLGILEKQGAKAPRVEQDFRRVLDDKSIDAVAIATPDHWHALLTVLGCQAGKDVYVEKPACHNVAEGQKMVEAARKYQRVVQHGTQRRSSPAVREAIEHLRSGGIGKVGMARAWIHQKRGSIGKVAASEPPSELDWALWQGPAPERPFHQNRVHYGWHWFWHYGTGELGNNGVHGLDVARWGLNVDAPLRVCSAGGKYHFDDDQEVPDTQVVSWEFDNCVLAYEHRMWSKHGCEGTSFGVAFYGDDGTLVIDDKGWRVEDGPTAGGPASDPQALHIANFIECVRSRQQPNADIAIGVSSARLCNLGNIAHRLGKKLSFDADSGTFVDAADANALLRREYGARFPFPEHV